jgi:ATP-dependent Lon protease
LEIIPVTTVDDVLARALAAPLTPIEWKDDSDNEPVRPAATEDVEGVLTH